MNLFHCHEASRNQKRGPYTLAFQYIEKDFFGIYLHLLDWSRLIFYIYFRTFVIFVSISSQSYLCAQQWKCELEEISSKSKVVLELIVHMYLS